MGNYRIIKYTNPYYKQFKVQKQSFFWLWYNFNNIDGCTTGFYDTLTEAKEAIDRDRSKTTAEILDV